VNASSAQPATPVMIGPSRLVRVAFGPLTKILNPPIGMLAGRRHVRFAALISHTGRRSGRRYVTPASARLVGDTFIIPLTFGNQSDWSRNVRAAGGCEIRLNGTDYRAIRPALADGDQVRDVAGTAFGPVERIMFRMLGIRQFLLLQRAGRQINAPADEG
jgi:deazaflavin-dependent oxidoreductase (nitroreductase family)